MKVEVNDLVKEETVHRGDKTMTHSVLSEEELRKRFPLATQIDSPDDLKALTPDQLPALAAEYRDYLIEICSRNGGHLGPSLGVVELTLALHRVFDSPKDKIVFDIGHQSYPHKLVTGRFRRFATLRQEHGVSGFCRRPESEHDIFGAGHAGTALSAAIGLCEGYRRRGDPHKIVALVGDAGLTSGMAYEALHQESGYKKNLIVILNDNEMSISPNVGAVNAFLSRKMTSPFLVRLHDEMKSAISKIPVVGSEVVDVLSKIRHSLKNFVIPTVIFEGFGFRYVGPIDGHDLDLLHETLNNVKQINEPVLVHVITEKGRGYAPALADKVTFHGCGPYDRETGKVQKEKSGTPPAYTKVFAETLLMLAKQDPKVVAITGAMPTGTGLSLFEKELPSQLYDVGIAEQHAVTFAGGLAIEGLRPYVAIYSTFMQRAYDQIIHDICIQDLNVKFCMDRAGFVGADGATHNGVFDIGFMRSVPGLGLCAPRDERELQELLKALDEHEGPAAMRYPRGSGLGVPLYQSWDEIPSIRWGSGEIISWTTAPQGHNLESVDRARSIPVEWIERLVRSGRHKIDLVLIGIGSTVEWARRVSEILARDEISVLVVNARFVKPLDRDLLRRISEMSSRWVVVEENVKMTGFGGAVLEFLESEDLLQKIRIRCLGIPDRFYEQASTSKLNQEAGIDEASILAASRELLDAEPKWELGTVQA